MTAQDCLQMLRDMRDVAFATVDRNGYPQARIIDVMLVEEGALYFCTSRGKDFHDQLVHSGRVAITGLNKDFQSVRLWGEVTKPEDQKYWIDRIFQENPNMNAVYPGQARYILDAFCIRRGELEFFDLSHEPIDRESFSIGGAELQPKGFTITDACIGCGICSEDCPQQCIREGTPFTIDQAHCLHCGLCAETCPTDAIERR